MIILYNEFPTPITSETDLTYYEKYLEQEFPSDTPPQTLCNRLKCYIGKAVRVDLSSPYRAENRNGVLKDIGQDFLIIKSPQQRECFIPFCALKSITVLQNNTKPPHF